MDLSTINNGWVAFAAGLITSPHCVLMCGPLAFVLLSPSAQTTANSTCSLNHPSILKVQAIYHVARVSSFTLMGILAGFLGLGLVAFLNFPLVRIFPWMLVAFLTLFVLGLDKLIPKAPFAKRFFARVSERLINLPKPAAAILLGVATPLLPCGPLYMILWVALISANPLFGAQIALGFGLGTVPLMFITGSQYSKYKDRFTPKTIYAIQRLLALIAVIFISFRLLSASGPLNGTFCCPW